MSPIVTDNRERVVELCEQFRVETLEVFGSAARDEFVPGESDVDFLVDFEEPNSLGIADRWFGLKDELSAALGCEVDLVSMRAIRNRVLRAEIERTKDLLYAA